MSELPLVESPNEHDPVAFRVAEVCGAHDPTPALNAAAGDLIRQTMVAAGVVDNEALMLVNLHSMKRVRRADAPQLNDLIYKNDRAEKLRMHLVRNNHDALTPEVREALQVLDTFDCVYPVSKDGLTMGELDEAGRLIQQADTLESGCFPNDSPETKVAQALGLTHYTYNVELIWVPTLDGSDHPQLKSERSHNALGVMNETGNFEHIVTILHPDHPARSHAAA